jgi:Zn-dependent protease with chaperone function
LIVFAAIILINVITTINPLFSLVTTLAIFVALPWLIMRGMRFNARVTSYRNIRFDFVGGAGGAFVAVILGSLLAAISLGFLLFALCVVLLAFGIYRYALPAMVEVAVLVTPPVVPQLISSGAINALDNTAFSPSRLSADRQQGILERFEHVAVNAEGGVRGYKLNFRSGGLIGPNAVALPDGNIVLTDELVELAGGDTEMIAAVLAHEIGHVEHKHSLRQICRAAGIAGLVMLIAGDVGSGVEDVLTQGGGLLALSYSRSAENEADRRSVDLMRRSGMDPAAIVRFFDMSETKLGDHSETSMLSTHPGTPDRKEAILKYAGNAN